MKNSKRVAATQFHTAKRIDNSRLVRTVEPGKMRHLYKALALSSILAAFFMLYIYQHFRCIDLSFQLEDLKARKAQATSLNGELKLEIAQLRDPKRIDVIARRQLGLTEVAPDQVQEFTGYGEAEVAAARYVQINSAP